MVSSTDLNELYVIGGSGNDYRHGYKTYGLKCPDSNPANCYFEELPVKVKYPRIGHVAFPISDAQAEEYCN